MPRILLASILGLVALAQAQNFAHVDSRFDSIKIGPEQMICWNSVSKDRDASQVEVYDRQGNLLTKISLLRMVPEAAIVSVDDAAISPLGTLIIAASYSRGRGTLAGSTLLYLDLHGRLLLAVGLIPSGQISRVAIDENSNIWTLTEGTALKDPSSVPMLVEYDSTGKVVRELLKRSDFPADADVNRDDVGLMGFGYDSGVVWFWLPGSQDFVTVNVSSGSFTKIHTGLPNKSPAERPMRVFRDSQGLVTRILVAPTPATRGSSGFFRWSQTTRAWSQIEPIGCRDRAHLIGLENGRGVFASPAAVGGLDICASEFRSR